MRIKVQFGDKVFDYTAEASSSEIDLAKALQACYAQMAAEYELMLYPKLKIQPYRLDEPTLKKLKKAWRNHGK